MTASPDRLINISLKVAVTAAIILLFLSKASVAQRPPDNTLKLREYEDTLNRLTDVFLDGSEQGIRQNACLLPQRQVGFF